jgi:hypothetical protein
MPIHKKHAESSDKEKVALATTMAGLVKAIHQFEDLDKRGFLPQ